MKAAIRSLALLIGVGSLVIACTLTSVGTIDHPLVLSNYSIDTVTYDGNIGRERLYIKVINALPNNMHTVTLTGLTDNVDLYTFSDAFITSEGSSTNAGSTDETCNGTTTAAGELYIMLDGRQTIFGSPFTLTAGT